MPPLSLPAIPSGKPTAWEEAIYAFLVEKRSRSGLPPAPRGRDGPDLARRGGSARSVEGRSPFLDPAANVGLAAPQAAQDGR